MLKTEPRLTVYKASAGSGKTFTLALEYIKLLMRDPSNYRYTLAVTFTNKATEEMKMRILGKLYALSRGLSDGNDYARLIHQAMPNLSEADIAQRATMALHGILHNYHYFRVETIDSFFQTVLRNLARELGLKANLNVGLNDKEVEEQAVDNMIENINNENDPLLGWMMDFIDERMKAEKNWNVIGQIKSFGTTIFRDFYKAHSSELEAIMRKPNFFRNYTGQLRAKAAACDKEMATLAQRYDVAANAAGLQPDDFSRKAVPAYFDKLRSGNYCGIAHGLIDKGIADPDTLVKKADRGTPKGNTVSDTIVPILSEAETKRKRAERTRYSVELTLHNLNELRLLGSISQQVGIINAETNNFPLSGTQQLLKDLIDDSDTPFIYERIGGTLKYIMIDEFQDTSSVQWDNFKVLLMDCLAHQAGSLIVGDVKQSIYRWRGGDWRLLQDLTPANHPVVAQKNLTINRRSQQRIVRFNNLFFTFAANITTEEQRDELISHYGQETGNGETASHVPEHLLRATDAILMAYEDVRQGVPKGIGKAGMVDIKLLPPEDYDAKMMEQVKKTIERLLQAHVPYHDIAILVRKNKHIQAIAEYFQQNAVECNGEEVMVNMVSDEAFRLDASLAVRILVGAMRFLARPDDRLNTAFLIKAYHGLTDSEADEELDSRLFLGHDDINVLLPETLRLKADELRALPISTLTERLYSIFQLDRLGNQSAYVCAFLDQLALLMKNRAVGLTDILEAWDTTLCAKPIHSDEINGIRLLTIHKSKGLEYPNVIIPYCDWDIEKTGDILWVEPHEKPYDALPVVPVSLQKTKLSNSIYCADYDEEHVKNLVDNLNLLYVAFTRATHNLFIIGANGPKAQYPSHIIQRVLEKQPLLAHTKESDDGMLEFTYGDLLVKKDKEKKTVGTKEEIRQENVFLQKEEPLHVDIKSYTPHYTFRQSNECDDFIMPQDEEDKPSEKAYIETGNILHALLANIRDTTDIDRAIDDLEFQGVLYDKPMTRESLRAMVHRLLDADPTRKWFDGHWQVMNECGIIAYDDKLDTVVQRRPDRVIYDGHEMIVIDFKTGHPYPRHEQQVREYIQLLQEMGYPNVHGYLWYLRTNQVMPVAPKAS